MERSKLNRSFLTLLRLGIGISKDANIPKDVDWNELKALADRHGLSAVVLDGIEVLRTNDNHNLNLPDKIVLTQWIGEVLRSERVYASQQKDAERMAGMFHKNGICTYVLKGTVIAECYPKPQHRVSVDMDCNLQSSSLEFTDESLESVERSKSVSENSIPGDVWEKGNRLIEEQGFEVKRDFYKNSTFFLPGLTVENHRYFTPFRGNGRLKKLERFLQAQLRVLEGSSVPIGRAESVEFRDSSNSSKCLSGSRIGDTWLYRPPVMVTALFLIEHAYSHFLHEGLTWRHVLDWMMFSRMHKDEIDWALLDAKIDEFGFRKFYDTYYRLGRFAIGELKESELTKNDKRMLEDVWAELDLHDTTEGFKGKLNLVGNTLRAWWKYHFFAEISMIHALWIQAHGVLFDNNPELR